MRHLFLCSLLGFALGAVSLLAAALFGLFRNTRFIN